MLFVGHGVEEVEPVGDGFAVLLFDGWEVGGGAGGLFVGFHFGIVHELFLVRDRFARHRSRRDACGSSGRAFLSGGRSSEGGFWGAT